MIHRYPQSAESLGRGSIGGLLRTDILGYRDTIRRYQREDDEPVVPSELQIRDLSCHTTRDNGDGSQHCQHGDGRYHFRSPTMTEPWNCFRADGAS